MISRMLAIFVLAIGPCNLGDAETLGEVLRSHSVAANGFSASEQAQKITSYAISKDEDPFLPAYYTDDGSGTLHHPLQVIRYSRSGGDLRRADLQESTASLLPAYSAERCQLVALGPPYPSASTMA